MKKIYHLVYEIKHLQKLNLKAKLKPGIHEKLTCLKLIFLFLIIEIFLGEFCFESAFINVYFRLYFRIYFDFHISFGNYDVSLRSGFRIYFNIGKPNLALFYIHIWVYFYIANLVASAGAHMMIRRMRGQFFAIS